MAYRTIICRAKQKHTQALVIGAGLRVMTGECFDLAGERITVRYSL